MKIDSLFLQIFNLSLTGSVVIFVVLLLRLILQKTPKRFSYILWFVVFFRLLSPFTLEAPMGMISPTEVADDYALGEEPISFFGAAEAAYQLVGDVANGGIGLQHVRTMERNPVTGNTIYIATDWINVLILFGSFIWIGGIVCLVLYNSVQFWKLQRKLVGAVPLRRNIFLSDYIESPFVIGVLKPKIFLPSSLSEKEQSFVILHEQHHIRRGDPAWKLFAFAAMCLHWFNPLVWYAISLFDKDMEMSCDEAVMEKVASDTRVEYSKTLLRFAVEKKALVGTPLAFGESDTIARVKNVIRYKKPAVWACVVAIIAIMAATVMLITEPIEKETGIWAGEYHVEKLIYNTYQSQSTDIYFSEVNEFHKTMNYQLSEYGLAMKMRDAEDKEVWVCEGDMIPIELTKEDLSQYMTDDNAWISKYKFTDITASYMTEFTGMNSAFEMKRGFFLLLQTQSSDTMLGLGWENQAQNGTKVKTLEWLDLLEISGTKDSVDEDFFNRLLEHATGEQITTFEFYESDDISGYLIVGFSSHTQDLPRHNETFTGPYGLLGPEHDMGFAVFQTNKNGTGYKLLDYHIYDNAINDGGSKIYYAEHPAVASVDGIIRDNNTFDVVFCDDERVKSIVRILDDGTEVTQTVKSGMTLLPWKDTKNSDRVKIYFLDEQGEEINFAGNQKVTTYDLSVNQELLNYREMTYKQFEKLAETEPELYHADFYMATIPNTSVTAVFHATKYDDISSIAYLDSKDAITRLEGAVGSIISGLDAEISMEELASSFARNGIVPKYSIEEGAGTAYYTANRYLKMWIDSDGDYKNDLLLQIVLNESNTVAPDSYMWLSW